ncbi:MAG: ATP-binding cassette domain-containing protein [Firmicutes bacterium]|jgi:ABC-type spermidine/putrescine transport systems, ATPase components|nr:ATP-binding cassette domain-containing protein [Bacillota bacterium]
MSLDMNIKKDFGGFVLDLELHAENEVLALLGASGCGKSMTLKCISGIVTPDEGYIKVNDRILFDSAKNINLSPQERHVGMLFQNYALFPSMTVEQNLMTGMATRKNLGKEQKKQIVREMIDKFYLTGLEKHKPSQLSGGQQQRVALARIMVSKPEILMLDEPFSALDSFLRWELERELMKVLEDFEGTSIIVSHNRDEVYRISDNIAVIADGHKDCYGSKEELFRNPPTYQSALLTGYRYFTRAEYIDPEHVRALDWNTILNCKTDPAVKYLTLRPEKVRVVSEAEAADLDNAPRFRVINSIDNLHEHILLLTAGEIHEGYGAEQDFEQLNIHISHEEWKKAEGAECVYLHFEEGCLIPLTK